MDMDASIWSRLPFEMVEHVLSFLLSPDVCRNRTVCKEWNQLIRSDKFAALHGQHARRRRGPSFIVMHRGPGILAQDKEIWCCLDLNARRWYTFNEDCNIGPFVSGALSLDGGLVCRLRRANFEQPGHAESSSQHHSIIVHNVTGLTNVVLPEIARHLNSSDTPKLLMVADNTSFKIFLINDNSPGTEILDDRLLASEERLKIQYDPLIHVYDSATCEWKSIVNTSWIIEDGGLGHITSVVMYHGFVYVLFGGLNEFVDQWRLLRYNLSVQSWENVDGFNYSFVTSSLVVSNDCLLLVAWCKEECPYPGRLDKWFLEVREIKTRDMTQKTLLRLSSAYLRESFDIEAVSQIGRRPFTRLFQFVPLSVIGFESSLFFMSQSSGKSKLFDLMTHSWDHVPSNPKARSMRNTFVRPWIGKHMNLLLPWSDWKATGSMACQSCAEAPVKGRKAVNN